MEFILQNGLVLCYIFVLITPIKSVNNLTTVVTFEDFINNLHLLVNEGY